MAPSTHLILLATVVAGLLSATAVRAAEDEPTLDSSRLLGQWRYQQKRLGASVDSVSVYEKGNRYRAHLEIKILSATSSVRLEGKWEVNGDDIKITITKSNSSLLFPVGKVLLKEQVTIGDKEMRYLHDGKQESERRLAGKAPKH